MEMLAPFPVAEDHHGPGETWVAYRKLAPGEKREIAEVICPVHASGAGIGRFIPAPS